MATSIAITAAAILVNMAGLYVSISLYLVLWRVRGGIVKSRISPIMESRRNPYEMLAELPKRNIDGRKSIPALIGRLGAPNYFSRLRGCLLAWTQNVG